MSTLQRRRIMMAQGVTYDGIPLMITNVGDEPSTLVIGHIIEHELYYKESAKSFYKPIQDNTLIIPAGETIHIFGYFIDVDVSNYAHFTFTGGQIHLEGSIRAIKSKASSVDVSVKASYYTLFSQNLNIISTSRDLFKEFDGVGLEESMFAFIFNECSNLETAPDLYCYNDLGYAFEGSFRNCSNLKKLPMIYCNSVYIGTFRYTFNNCSSMDMVDEVTVPSAGGTSHTYTSMFDGCKSLTKLPNFTDNGASYCNFMFKNCTNITDASNITLGVVGRAPALVAYVSMFSGCTNLVHAPKILITTLGDERPNYWGAFNLCFSGCTKLDKLEVNFNAFTPSNFNSWMRNVSPTGTFICTKELGQALEGYYQSDGTWVEPTVSRGESTVPEGWYIDYPIIDARDGDTNAAALMAVIFAQKWSKNSLYMMKSEAEKVEDIKTVFAYNNCSATDYTCMQYFVNANFPNFCFSQSKMEKVTLPNTLSTISANALQGTLIDHINLPDSVTTILGGAFYNVKNLKSIDFNKVTKLDGYNHFLGSGLESLYIPKTLTIGSGSFRTCAYLESIIVEEEHPTYDSRENCNAIILKSNNSLIVGCNTTIIPDSVTSIGSSAFEGSQISYIDIHAGVTSIGWGAFANCTNLQTVILRKSTRYSINVEDFQNVPATFYVPSELLDEYKVAAIWSTMADRIKPISELPQ